MTAAKETTNIAYVDMFHLLTTSFLLTETLVSLSSTEPQSTTLGYGAVVLQCSITSQKSFEFTLILLLNWLLPKVGEASQLRSGRRDRFINFSMVFV